MPDNDHEAFVDMMLHDFADGDAHAIDALLIAADDAEDIAELEAMLVEAYE